MDVRTTIRLRDGAFSQTTNEGRTVLRSFSDGVSLGELTPAQRAMLDQLSSQDCVADELVLQATMLEGGKGLAGAHGLLTRLCDGGWLDATVSQGSSPLLTIGAAKRKQATFDPATVEGTLVLSRFAILRRDDGKLLLESPRSAFTAHIRNTALLSVIGALAEPTTLDALSAGGLSEEAIAVAVGTLVACGAIVSDKSEEETDFELLKWTPHELWFHSRSRGGWRQPPWGATYWAKGVFSPLPATRPAFTGPSVDLFRPDTAEIATRDPSLIEVMENRRSLRIHDDARPMTAGQLGEFLYRVARTRGIRSRDGVEEVIDRPFPSGGAMHELELYPVITNVEGVEPGLYHYDGLHHRLELLVESPSVRSLARRAQHMAVMTAPPQVLVVVAARFGRLMWKYQTMAYALALQNVGVLYAAMYHVATAMKLAPCAIGGGDSELFARASGLDPIAEASIGEFVLGSFDRTRRG